MESYIANLLILIPALPLLATAVVAVLGKRVLREQSHWPVALALAGSCVASVLLIFAVQSAETNHKHEHLVKLWSWAAIEGTDAAAQESARWHRSIDWQVAIEGTDPAAQDSASESAPAPRTATPAFYTDVVLRADSLTAIMLGMVTFISTLVVIYASGYMHGDPGYWRFFAYVALFVFSMTMLVSVSNFVLLYVFWEAVGLCSYLLIGFWFEKPVAAAAGMKAFLVNRVGDFGFALGVFLIWTTFGTLNFHDSKVETIAATKSQPATTVVHIDPEEIADPNIPGTIEKGIFGHERLTGFNYPEASEFVITAICLLLLVGACGKSAQFPLHVWLPDAMEGPTPVSALIHAATMVTAGVYLVARCTPLYAGSPYAQELVATIGGFTALFAALIALTQTDLKRILAYSTVSQLGYMFLALGTGSELGVSSGMFHLFTHAFFKALLFLGAGSVMHAMGGVIDIREFGGLRRKMPVTHWTFLFGCLALSGIVPFAGFWSKDAIIDAVHEKAAELHPGSMYPYLYYSAVLTAFLTAFYTFRAYFLTFHGEERIPKEAGHHAHESPPAMTGPLVILAIGALTVGAYFQWHGDFLDTKGFLMQTPSLTALQAEMPAKGFDYQMAAMSTVVALAGIGLAWLFYVARPDLAASTAASAKSMGLYALSHGKFFIDEIYAIVIVRPLELFSLILAEIDRFVIDGIVNAIGAVPRVVGAAFRPLQGGLLQFYALVMALGVLALAGALLW
jgi:NADH-quinone oxidoreductase subunit L